MVLRNIIGGKYRLKNKIGEGAMGVVWAAINQQTSREVAVKLIISEDDQLRHRLIREARACGQLSHRNIIEVLDAGATEERDPFLVMPLLVGETLGDLLKRKRRLAPEVVVQIARDIAKALTAAHAASIVHRDLKPANIFLHREPGSVGAVVKVMDFGICKRLESKDEKLTATGKVIGSPLYMSPEQFAPTKGIDHRTDIWSLGVIMFEMLTGDRPFQGDRMKVILSIIDSDIEIPRVSRLVRFVPPALVDIVADCLVRDREQRIGTAAELVERLEAMASPGDTVNVYGEVSRRGSMPSTPEAPLHTNSEPSDSEDRAARVVHFPQSLDDSSAITLPREPGPRRPAARRRPAAATPPAPQLEPAAEEVEKEIETEGGSTDESTLLNLKFASTPRGGPEADVDDLAVTAPLSARHYAAASSGPAASTPEIAPPSEALTTYAPPIEAAASASPAPIEVPAPTFKALDRGDEPSDPMAQPSMSFFGPFSGSRWASSRVRSMTPRMVVIGGMVVAATVLFAVAFVAAAVGSPVPEAARSSLPDFDPGAFAAPAPPKPDVLPAVDRAARPTTPAEQRSTVVAPSPPGPPRLKPPQAAPSGSSVPKCQGKLIKKC